MKFLHSRRKEFESLGEKISKPVLAVAIGVLLVCQLGSFAITCRWIRSRNAQIVENQLNYMEASVQEKTMDIQRMLFGIQVNDTFDQALRRLVFNGEENPVYAESEISRILSVNKGTMPLVSNLYVCSPDFLVADMTTLRNYEKDYRQSQAYRLYEGAESAVFFGTAGADDIFLTSREVIPVGYRFRLGGYSSPIAIVANLDQERLNGYLREEIGDSGMVGLADGNGQLIAWNQKPDGEREREKAVSQLAGQSDLEAKTQGIVRIGPYIAGFRSVGATPWRVLYITSEQRELQVLLGIGVIYTVCSAAAIVVMVSFVRRKVRCLTGPLRELAGKMSNLETWEEEECLSYQDNDEIRVLFDSFNQMLRNTSHYIRQLEEEKQRVKTEQSQKRKAEFKALQAQIQPHFLYNTLESIHWKAEEAQAQEISDMVQALATFFRINLSRGKELISLRDEIAHVESYLRIQQIRYGNQLEYEIQVQEEILDSVLPKLILQPLVENSIYHGIREKEGEGMIGITGRKAENGDVLLCVEDNGVGILPEQLKNLQEKLVSGEKVHQEGYGIFNVNQRIQLNYGVPYGLSIWSQAGKGTKVEIRMPYTPEEEVESNV